MTFVILILTLIAAVIVVAIIYRAVMVRRRTPSERAESPHQIRH